jgi:serine/threonine-protein kinase
MDRGDLGCDTFSNRAPVTAEAVNKPVDIAGKYVLLRALGKGAMGSVYEANHRTLKKRVAIKILHEQHAGDNALMRRFAREATAISQLRSRYVVRVFDSDKTADGAPFIVMEMLSGRDLAAHMRGRKLATTQVVDWIVQICSAMNEAHRLGIIHRDLKPSNIFIAEPDQSVRVLDFGISRLVEGHELTANSEILGTPNYIAPEVLQGRPADARSDLYAIGVIAYRAFSGRFPCEPKEDANKNPFSALIATVTVPAKPLDTLVPDLPKELTDAVMKALAKNPRDRFASARDLAMALRPFGTAAANFEVLPESESAMPVRDLSSAPPPSIDVAQDTMLRSETQTLVDNLAAPTIANSPVDPNLANSLTNLANTTDLRRAQTVVSRVRLRDRNVRVIALGALVIVGAVLGKIATSTPSARTMSSSTASHAALSAAAGPPPALASVVAVTSAVPSAQPPATAVAVSATAATPSVRPSIPVRTPVAAASASTPKKELVKHPKPAHSGEVLFIE